jgi:hypothetical protein
MQKACFKRRRILFSSLPLAISALLGAGQAFAADLSSPQISPAMRAALQRDLGLSASELPRYLDAERAAMRKQAEAQGALGADFAGSWLERNAGGEYRLVVASTRRDAVANAKLGGAEVRVVSRSLAELDAIKAKLDRGQATRSVGVLRQTDPSIHAWRVDLPSNSVVVTSDSNAGGAAMDFVARHGVDPKTVRFETSKARPQPTFDIRGGDRYWTPTGGCSVGFSVASYGDITGFATAGHCGPVNAGVSGANNVDIGSFAGSQFPGADQAWVRNTNPAQWVAQPWVNNYAGGNQAVVGTQDVPIGGAICRSGATTGYRCGAVTAKNVTVNYSVGLTYNLVQSTACVGFGDSGGSFISPGGEANGVTSGGVIPGGSNDNCGVASPVTFHQPIQPLLNSYSLLVLTTPTCGRLNPGYTLNMNQSVTSCDGRFTLVMQGDGNLVLYQAGVGSLWSTNTWLPGNQGANYTARMQTDGNLVVYNSASQSRWSSRTWGRPGATLFVQDDGNVVIYTPQWQPIWASNTCCR